MPRTGNRFSVGEGQGGDRPGAVTIRFTEVLGDVGCNPKNAELVE